jgi:hypothetical protein
LPFIDLPGDKAHKTRRAGRHDKYYQQQDDPVNAPASPVETRSAIFGTNSTNKPPNRLPGIEPTPPTTAQRP